MLHRIPVAPRLDIIGITACAASVPPGCIATNCTCALRLCRPQRGRRELQAVPGPSPCHWRRAAGAEPGAGGRGARSRGGRVAGRARAAARGARRPARRVPRAGRAPGAPAAGAPRGAPAPAVTDPPDAGLCGRGRPRLQPAAYRSTRPAGERSPALARRARPPQRSLCQRAVSQVRQRASQGFWSRRPRSPSRPCVAQGDDGADGCPSPTHTPDAAPRGRTALAAPASGAAARGGGRDAGSDSERSMDCGASAGRPGRGGAHGGRHGGGGGSGSGAGTDSGSGGEPPAAAAARLRELEAALQRLTQVRVGRRARHAGRLLPAFAGVTRPPCAPRVRDRHTIRERGASAGGPGVRVVTCAVRTACSREHAAATRAAPPSARGARAGEQRAAPAGGGCGGRGGGGARAARRAGAQAGRQRGVPGARAGQGQGACCICIRPCMLGVGGRAWCCRTAARTWVSAHVHAPRMHGGDMLSTRRCARRRAPTPPLPNGAR